ncbi:MAG: hypothetical protein AB1758_20255 [Candidatus Eremiobacterota bacterium]
MWVSVLEAAGRLECSPARVVWYLRLGLLKGKYDERYQWLVERSSLLELANRPLPELAGER